jgi:hypothetical protein
MVIATLENLTEIHTSDSLCCLSGVVIIININDQAAEKLPDTISDFVLKFV